MSFKPLVWIDYLQRLHNEIAIWRTLHHENILSLIGITFDFGPTNTIGMVSPWLENGTLTSFLQRHDRDLVRSDRFRVVSVVHLCIYVLTYKISRRSSYRSHNSCVMWHLACPIVSTISRRMISRWLLTFCLVHSCNIVHGDLTGVRSFKPTIFSITDLLCAPVQHYRWRRRQIISRRLRPIRHCCRGPCICFYSFRYGRLRSLGAARIFLLSTRQSIVHSHYAWWHLLVWQCHASGTPRCFHKLILLYWV